MLIFQFHHYIKPEFVEAYKDAILENACLTLPEEGVLRSDVFQDTEDPPHFNLLEIYRDLDARETHLETPHFMKFKDTVVGKEMFVRKGKRRSIRIIYPRNIMMMLVKFRIIRTLIRKGDQLP